MSNDLGINEDTNSIQYQFDAKPGQADTLMVSYRVSPRDGATADMINETVRHFKLAVRTLVAGLTNVRNVPERSLWIDDAGHSEARVVIYSFGGFPVPFVTDDDNNDSTIKFDINIFNEYSTAANCVEHAWMHIRAMADGEHSGDLIVSGKPVPQPAKPQSELDKAFGPRKEAPPPPEPPAISATPPPVPGDSIIDLDYDYKLKEQYEQDYVGRKVRVLVKKIQWRVEGKKDGTGSYEMIQLFKEAHYENPIYDLSIWPPNPDDKYGNGKELMRCLPDGALVKPGDYIEGDIYIDYKINKSDNGKVYWNIKSVNCQNMTATTNEPEALHPGDEIPF